MNDLNQTLDSHDESEQGVAGLDPATDADAPGVEVRRNGGVSAVVGAVASTVGIAYLSRAIDGGTLLDWLLCAVLGVMAVAHLLAYLDARVPLLVADEQGVRIRLGRSWHGLVWPALARVEHRPRRGLLRDGRLVLTPVDGAEQPDLDPSARRQRALNRRWYGAPLTVPLGLTTRVVGADGDLAAALQSLAGDLCEVVEVLEVRSTDVAVDEASDSPDLRDDEAGHGDVVDQPADVSEEGRPEAPHRSQQSDEIETNGEPEEDLEDEPAVAALAGPRWHDPRPALARGIGAVAARLQRAPAGPVPGTTYPAADLPMVASATPAPLRDPVTAARAEVHHDLVQGSTALRLDPSEADDDTRVRLPEGRELHRPGSVSLVEDTQLWGDRVRPIARAGSAVPPLVIDDLAAEPAPDPVIGPELAAARTRLGLTVDQLAERTRIRPHVIESIEVDDFVPCGGDFYARGHLRTLARVLGIDVAPLLADYDERYADAPISPRRVFEAELATGAHGPIRGTRGGPNWSVLVAAVMTIVLVWSIARLVMDSPVTVADRTPPLNGSAGLTSGQGRPADPVPVVLTAAAGGAHVVVRDATGTVVFTGDLAFGQTRELKASPPVQVQSSDGSVEVSLAGVEAGPVGETGQPAQNTFVAPEQ